MRPKWTFAVVSTALFMVVLDNLVVTTALPSIRAIPWRARTVMSDFKSWPIFKTPGCSSRGLSLASASVSDDAISSR